MEHSKRSSTTAKTALGFGIGGATLAIANTLGNGNGLLGGLIGGNPAAFQNPVTLQGGYVTEKELCLVRESSEKDAVIAQLRAEKYADTQIRQETEPLKTRVCNLETQIAVNAARDQDFRHYVNREFIHQPTARINESIVTCHNHNCCDRDCHDHHC